MTRRYIRHHNGVVHSVNADEFNTHLAQAQMYSFTRSAAGIANPGIPQPFVEPAREATPDEVRGYWERQGFVYLPETDEALTPAEAAARQASQPAATPAPDAAKTAKPAKE